MATFGKVDFATSLNPTSAFPLDGRVVFDSLEDAQNAASSAKPIGSTQSRYYYGMKLLVTSTNTWYKITSTNALEEESSASAAELGIVWCGDYTTSSNYKVNDVVYFEGSSYVCIKAHGIGTAQLPTNSEYWHLLAKGGAGTGGISFTTDESLTLTEDNVLKVNVETAMVPESDRPISSDAVYNVVGDIDTLLGKI